MRELLTSDAGRPRVTWYGPQHERVEFSAKTLNNWVSKTANLLVDELDAGPGSRIGIALPGHWRTVAWLLAGWAVGAHTVVLPDHSGAAEAGSPVAPLDVLVTDRPSAPPAGTQESVLVVVALPALATRFLGDVPSGALDAAAEVRRQPDFFQPGPPPAPADPAFTIADRLVPHGDLLAAARAAGLAPGVRLLTGAGPERALEAYLAPLAAGGSVVIHHDLAGLSDAERAHLSDQEGVTAVDL